MTTVNQLLQAKSSEIWVIKPQASVYDALQLMADRDIGALLVVENGKAIGIFTERDYARKTLMEERSSRAIEVHELMTQPVLYVRPEQTIEDCMALMTVKRTRHLAVHENGRLIGIVSIGDVVKEIISEQQTTIRELESYIAGTHYRH